MFKKSFILSLCITLLTPHLLFAESNIDFFFKNSSEYEEIIVKKVKSADTIILENNNIIKLIGLKSSDPDKKELEEPAQEQNSSFNNLYTYKKKTLKLQIDSVELTAFKYVKNLLEGKKVRLEFDIVKKNEKNVSLAYVFLLKEKIFVNEDILKQGHVYLSISPPNTKYAEVLRNAYKEAKKYKRSLLGQY